MVLDAGCGVPATLAVNRCSCCVASGNSVVLADGITTTCTDLEHCGAQLFCLSINHPTCWTAASSATPQCMSSSKALVLANYRQLLRLIQRLPHEHKNAALAEASHLMRQRQHSTNPEDNLQYQKELAAKVGYMKVITPRKPSDADQAAGTYVLRDGKWVQGKGASPGSRVADGTIAWDDAIARNKRDFKRFYGADKPKDVFF